MKSQKEAMVYKATCGYWVQDIELVIIDLLMKYINEGRL